MNENSCILSTSNLSVGWDRMKGPVQSGLNLNLERGRLTCLLGLNGTGKSTFLKTISGLIPPICGRIIINGIPIEKYSGIQLAKTVSVVLTEKTYSGGLTARETVAIGRYPYTGYLGKLSHHDNEIVDETLRRIGIDKLSDKLTCEMSDGERQKIMIAKALAQESDIIVLDEPTAYLDVTSKISIMQLLHDLAHQTGKTILLSTHDLEIALKKADDIWILRHQLPAVQGNPEQLVRSGEINGIFCLKDFDYTHLFNAKS